MYDLKSLAATLTTMVVYETLIVGPMRRRNHALTEENEILRDAMDTANHQSDYLINIINEAELGTPFDNIVLNSLL